MTGLRDMALWRELVAWAREHGIHWPEDDIARVVGKVRAPTPDDLPDAIGHVLLFCAAAERDADSENAAAVSLWRQLPHDLIEITVTDGQVFHRLNPDIDVRIEP